MAEEKTQFPEYHQDPSFQIPFITNAGQVDGRVAYYTNTQEGTVFITKDGEIRYLLRGVGDGFAVREHFSGSLNGVVVGKNPAHTRVNVYKGSDSSKWRNDLPTFRSVDLGRRYDLIDVRLVKNRGAFEKIFVVHPGGDVADIKGRFENARSLTVDDAGRLVVSSANGTVLFSRPSAHQVKGLNRLEVAVSYRVRGKDYGFTVGEHDPSLILIIDPLLASSYVGGSSNETTYAMSVSGGDIILAGTADSHDFPGLDEGVNALGDALLLRLDPDFSTVRGATYFGGSMTDGVRDMVVAGNTIYAAGYNNSPNFPTTAGAAFSGTSLSGSFVARLDAGTLRITAATSYYANVFALARAPGSGDIYIAGSTGNTGFPIPGSSYPAFQSTHMGGADSFITMLDEDLTSIKGATLLGGEGFDIIYDLTVDDRGYPVAAGVTNSAAFPVSETAFDDTYNLDWEANHQWIDGFVARLTPDLGGLQAATYLGGGWNDSITAVKAESSIILVGGSTSSSDFPCASTFGPVDGNDAFVVLLNDDLSDVRSCSVFGGSRPGTDSPESVSDVAVHPTGTIYATGRTNAGDFPTTPGALLERPSGSYFGAFIIAFNSDMSRVEASTLIRGGSEDLKALAFDRTGNVIVAGDTSGGGYPVTPGALQQDHSGGDDLVVSRLTPDLTGAHIEVVPKDLDFGYLPVGMESKEELVIHNTGGAELNLLELRLISDTPSVFSFLNQCSVIPAFTSCTLEVVFKPFLTGTRSASLVVHSNDPFRGQLAVNLKGTAINAPVTKVSEDPMMIVKDTPSPLIEVRPDPCDFGEVKKEMSVTRTVNVSNIGFEDLDLKQVVLDQDGSGPFVIVRDSCSDSVLKAGKSGSGSSSSCEVMIAFTPGSAGRAEGWLRLISNDPASPRRTVFLTGTGVDQPGLGIGLFWIWLPILVLVLTAVLLAAGVLGLARRRKRTK